PASSRLRPTAGTPMSPTPNEDAEMANAHRSPTGLASAAEPREQLVRRWRDLRAMMIQQLEMFETGGLTLRSNEGNISDAAIADLKRHILEFDALISGG